MAFTCYEKAFDSMKTSVLMEKAQETENRRNTSEGFKTHTIRKILPS